MREEITVVESQTAVDVNIGSGVLRHWSYYIKDIRCPPVLVLVREPSSHSGKLDGNCNNDEPLNIVFNLFSLRPWSAFANVLK